MGRGEFSIKTGIPKSTLVGIETSDRDIRSSVLTAIAQIWPEYAAYLLTDKTGVKQINPEEGGMAIDPDNPLFDKYKNMVEQHIANEKILRKTRAKKGKK